MKTKSKNPLYVVTNDGKDIEEAQNFLDVFIKKFGLKPVINLINDILKVLIEQVKSYSGFLILKNFIDQIVVRLEKLIKKIDPVLAFSIFN